MTDGESLLTFPCSFPIKIMGRDQESFRHAAVLLVEQHAGKLPDDAINTSTSRNGNFLSITITIEAQSQEQLDSIYSDLSDHDAVLVAL
jgi:putative lipoic acid-binding regulatory protein